MVEEEMLHEDSLALTEEEWDFFKEMKEKNESIREESIRDAANKRDVKCDEEVEEKNASSREMDVNLEIRMISY